MSHSPLPALIEQMLTPQFYPHPVQTPIQLVQTHAAYVLLTGNYAYKLKKPVNFGFLDYSTLSTRLHCLSEELRLNRRSAAELYLGVLPISQSGDRYCLGGVDTQNSIVEYTLQMRQFPPGNLFSDLMTTGQLTPELMVTMAQETAKLHAKAAVNDHIRSYGNVTAIRQSIDENFRQSQPYIGRGQTAEQFAATQTATERFFIDQTQLFADRLAQNKIRECHGDLHLGNVCRWGDRVLLFDCIEFNEPFRMVDTMYDIGFAVMDCEAQGRPDLGAAFLNAYLELTGDWEGLQILPLYLSRQAYVRAKVTSFLLDDASVAVDRHPTLQRQAAHYYTLAHHYAQRLSPGQPGPLFLITGLSGSGKTTVARQLTIQLTHPIDLSKKACGRHAQRASHTLFRRTLIAQPNAPSVTTTIHIRSDAVRKHLAGIPLAQKGDASVYSPAMTQATYDRLQDLALRLCRLGCPVILDAKYDRLALRQPLLAAAQAQGIPVQILHCVAPPEVLRDRLRRRRGDITDATVELLDTQLANAEDFTPAEQQLVTVIDTTQDLTKILKLCCP